MGKWFANDFDTQPVQNNRCTLTCHIERHRALGLIFVVVQRLVHLLRKTSWLLLKDNEGTK